MKLKFTLFAALGCVILCGCVKTPLFGPGEFREVVVQASPRWFESQRIALIDIEGIISSRERGMFYSGSGSPAEALEKLRRAAADSSVKAIVLRINSPGGAVGATDRIYEEVLRFRRETKKPVVAMLMSVAASGGYYVACGADTIVASRTTVTGSVGVIMQFMNLERLFAKIGIQSAVIKSGEKKDIGSPFRTMTQAERAYLQDINRQLFERFRDVVRKGRPAMTDDQFKQVADARIVTAADALRLGMIDRVGSLSDALAEARKRAGISAAKVIMYRAGHSPNVNIYARSATPTQILLNRLALNNEPGFYYLWKPGR